MRGAYALGWMRMGSRVHAKVARRAVALLAAGTWLAAGNATAFLDTGTLLTNAASATYMGGGQGTSVTYSATAKILVANPAVFVWKDVTPTYMATSGGNVTYTLCFSNGGANTAFNVTIFDKLPNNTYWSTAYYSAWWSQLSGVGSNFTSNGATQSWGTAIPPSTPLTVPGSPPIPTNTGSPATYLQWVVPALGLGRSGCITFVLSLG